MSASVNFAVNCRRYGISTAQCPDASLRWWSNYTKQRSQTAWDTYYAPLMAQLDPEPVGGESVLTFVTGQGWISTPKPPAQALEPGERWIREGQLASLRAAIRPPTQQRRYLRL